ncbi:FecR family protein [Pseudogemmobacter sonorensis]|uniref:FecR family protein n=1 Tax=Pseudogemmobacter sonorensis TaxID=2989681 RepID=UPI0036BD2A05
MGDTPLRQTADDEALGWFVLLRDDDITGEDRLRFRRWLKADPTHEAAWEGAQALWNDLEPTREDAAWLGGPLEGVPIGAAAARPRRARFAMLLAATIGALTIGLGWHLTPVGLFADHRAGVGQRERVRLADGSEVELGAASALDVDFTASRREVRLLAGEAFFTVAPDAARPFLVRAGGGEVVVRGTAFNVRIADETRVSVTEHTVEVSTGGGPTVSVTEGEEVSFGRGGVSAVRQADLDLVQAWRHGQLVFIDTPLDAVIAELGRYRHGYIRLIGGDLGQMRVTAVFRADRPDEALETIARSLGLEIWCASDLLIGLRRG